MECHYADPRNLFMVIINVIRQCHYNECCNLFIVMLNVIILSVVILNVVMLNVVAPSQNDCATRIGPSQLIHNRSLCSCWPQKSCWKLSIVFWFVNDLKGILGGQLSMIIPFHRLHCSKAGNSHWKGRTITIDLLVQISCFIYRKKIFIPKQAILNRRPTVPSLPFQ
jgi:hypothetical protein